MVGFVRKKILLLGFILFLMLMFYQKRGISGADQGVSFYRDPNSAICYELVNERSVYARNVCDCITYSTIPENDKKTCNEGSSYYANDPLYKQCVCGEDIGDLDWDDINDNVDQCDNSNSDSEDISRSGPYMGCSCVDLCGNDCTTNLLNNPCLEKKKDETTGICLLTQKDTPDCKKECVTEDCKCNTEPKQVDGKCIRYYEYAEGEGGKKYCLLESLNDNLCRKIQPENPANACDYLKPGECKDKSITGRYIFLNKQCKWKCDDELLPECFSDNDVSEVCPKINEACKPFIHWTCPEYQCNLVCDNKNYCDDTTKIPDCISPDPNKNSDQWECSGTNCAKKCSSQDECVKAPEDSCKAKNPNKVCSSLCTCIDDVKQVEFQCSPDDADRSCGNLPSYNCNMEWACVLGMCVVNYKDGKCSCKEALSEKGVIDCGLAPGTECDEKNMQCPEWSKCEDGRETRECICPDPFEKKTQSRDCAVNDLASCFPGFHRDQKDPGECLEYSIKVNKDTGKDECAFKPADNNCLCKNDKGEYIEGSNSCYDDPIKQECDPSCKECKTEYKRPFDFNSIFCQKKSPDTYCQWKDVDPKECYIYETSNNIKKYGNLSCLDDQIYQQFAPECKNCISEIGRSDYNNVTCWIRNPGSFCVFRETNPCSCANIGGSKTCDKDPLWKMCSGKCQPTECPVGYHRKFYNLDICGIYVLDDKKNCVFQEIPDKLKCLGIEGTDSCADDEIKKLTEECNQGCTKTFKRTSTDYNDCFIKDKSTGCEPVKTDLINCLGIDGSNTCEKDPIYNKYSGKCTMVDADNDGIDDKFDVCPATEAKSVIDKDGCSCGQKKCDDKNPCTDDSCSDKAECTYNNNDKNICGEDRACPESGCENKYPYEKWLEYPKSGRDYCESGKCITYSCDIITAAYSASCDKKTPEECDGIDNDFNGKIDDNLTAPFCELQEGVCRGSKKICKGFSGWEGCSKENYGQKFLGDENPDIAGPSICDGIDNDCDGTIDEGCGCINGNTKKCGIDTGECRAGVQKCIAGIWEDCKNYIGYSIETCDRKDNNCNGYTDESDNVKQNLSLRQECNINSCKGENPCTEKGLGDCQLFDDIDNDGYCIALDNCPDKYNPDQKDSDKDGIGEACDLCPADISNDADMDSVCGNIDNCPDKYNSDQKDSDRDSLGDVCDLCPLDKENDFDSDGICGNNDNCLKKYNPGQEDCNKNGIGDACDPNSPCSTDSDNDAINDNIDNCPLNKNSDQKDSDGEGIGDVCDPCPADKFNDVDKDDVCGNKDNCPLLANPDQKDSDGDGIGNMCDKCVLDTFNDRDGDNICGNIDSCPNSYNPSQADCDKDNIGDACDFGSKCSIDSDKDYFNDNMDNCADYYNPDQKDSDGDGIGDACDPCLMDKFNDLDKDGICGDVDNCISIINPSQKDSDRDSIGDACDLCPLDKQNDIDHDGICGNADNCPLKANPSQADCDYNGIGDACDQNSKCIKDLDKDNFADLKDNCPEKNNPDQLDKDGDGIGDLCDTCPADPFNDIDNDGICGNKDNCPVLNNPNQKESDKDKIGDACDKCPYDPENDADKDGICGDQDSCRYKNNPSQSDCDKNGIGDACDLKSKCAQDIDEDGRLATADNCPEKFNPGQSDSDGDGIGDACDICAFDKYNDIDNDGICGNFDNCPLVFNPQQTDSDGDSIGDACDLCLNDPNNDIDEDGICGNVDNCPAIKNPDQEPCDSIVMAEEVYDKTVNLDTNQENIEKIISSSYGRIPVNISVDQMKQDFDALKKFIQVEQKKYMLNGREYTRYKITINSKKQLSDFAYYSDIPKCLASKADNIFFNGKNYNIIEKDPLIAWHFANVTDKVEITFDAEGSIPDDCISQMKEFVISSNISLADASPSKTIIPIAIIIFIIIFALAMQIKGKK